MSDQETLKEITDLANSSYVGFLTEKQKEALRQCERMLCAKIASPPTRWERG